MYTYLHKQHTFSLCTEAATIMDTKNHKLKKQILGLIFNILQFFIEFIGKEKLLCKNHSNFLSHLLFKYNLHYVLQLRVEHQ